MTGYTVHTGTSKKFVSGWDRVFSEKKSSQSDKGTAKKSKNTAQKRKKK
ncbi:MAG: hypothetical protein KDB01_09655 [Planctomycetaceae bacterium]|nr:hypothetical protein [Planctomycetaceae bacterium]